MKASSLETVFDTNKTGLERMRAIRRLWRTQKPKVMLYLIRLFQQNPELTVSARAASEILSRTYKIRSFDMERISSYLSFLYRQRFVERSRVRRVYHYRKNGEM